MDLEIIGASQSSYVRTVRIACEEKGVPYHLTPALPHSPDVLAIHPLGKIPVMRHGNFELFESRAIAGYIDRVFPGPKLFPEDAERGARIEQWVSVCNASIIPVLNGYLQCFFFSGLPGNTPDEAGMAERLPNVTALIAVLDRAIATNGCLASREFSYADMNLLPVLDYLSVVPQSAEILNEAKLLADYLTMHSERQSFRATKPLAFAELAT